ncbi:MAG: hypothetical protein ACRDOI_40410 [Trebonia sp.]
MTATPASARKPLVWFPDTSALVTMAVHAPLEQAVREALSAHRRVLLTAVVAELEGLAKAPHSSSAWASVALGQLGWLGKPVVVDEPIGVELAAGIQERIAAGRPLLHQAQHYGEAAIISLASRAQQLRPVMLSDDYDARVAAKAFNIEPLSIHKLMHLMIKQCKITAAQAFRFAEALDKAGRAKDYSAGELTSGRLGRVGQP